MKRKKLQTKALDSKSEFASIVRRLGSSEDSDPKDIIRFRELVAATPNFWPHVANMFQMIGDQLIEKMATGLIRAFILGEADALKKQLGWDGATPLEQLLIDQVVTARLRVIYAENCYTKSVVEQRLSIEMAEYWERMLAAAQARYLRAIETLARVSRLARNIPALQINIAQQGGQQVNTQGDVSTGT